MHATLYELELEPALEEFGRVHTFLEQVCEAGDFWPETRLRARLVVEELFTNTVKHGFSESLEATIAVSAAMIRITASVQDDEIQLLYCDTGVAYNPLAPSMIAALMAMTEHEIETREPGGLGCMLIQSMSDGAEYLFEAGQNKVCLVFKNRNSEDKTSGAV